jgi:peptide deformylase
MSIKEIIQLESPNDQNTRLRLAIQCAPVEDFDEPLARLIDDLLDTLTANKIAIGLAAPQIGVALRVAVVHLKVDVEAAPIVMINPQVLSETGKKDIKKESCMSVPDVRGSVERRHKISVSYQDHLGDVHVLNATGFLARVVAHEIDHLDGLLYLDKMRKSDRLEATDIFREGT